jgi:alpha-glucosidase (family GH31 glycosyl hydrolase)
VNFGADHIPVFVAGGSFVPMTRTFANSAQYSFSDFVIHYYYDESVTTSEGQAYNDDGKTPQAFEKGAYELLKFSAKNTAQSMRITLSDEVGKNYQTSDKKATLTIHNMPMNVKKITIDGQEVSAKMSGRKAEIQLLWNKGINKEIQIQF